MLRCEGQEGNRADVSTYVDDWLKLKAVVGRADCLFIGDCKLAAHDTLLASMRQGGRFLAPWPGDAEVRKKLAAWVLTNTVEARIPRRHAQGREVWSRRVQRAQVLVDAAGREDRCPVHLRFNPRRQAEQQATLERRLGKTQAFLADLPKQLGTRGWQRREAIDKATRLGGDVPLLTHDPALTTQQALTAYTEQSHPERRFTWLKGAGLFAPVLRQSPKRIEAFFFVVGLVLQLFTLVEREAARQIAHDGAPVLGLKPNHLQEYRPKTEAILAAFRKVTVPQVVFADQSSETGLCPWNPVQERLLHVLALDESIDTLAYIMRPLVALDSSYFVVRLKQERNVGCKQPK